MKSLVSFLLSFAILQYVSAQAPDFSENLGKYSYPVVGFFKDDSAPTAISFATGSGFFMKFHSRLFFISAKHVLCGFGDSCVKYSEAPDLMYVCLHDSGGKLNNQRIVLDVKKLRDTAICRPIISFPDISVMEVPADSNLLIYSIEHLLHSVIPAPDQDIVIYGYPASNLIDPKTQLLNPPSGWTISHYKIEPKIGWPFLSAVTKDLPLGEIMVGVSGSPVFLRDKNRWAFIGIYSASSSITNSFFFVKPSFLVDELNRLSHLSVK